LAKKQEEVVLAIDPGFDRLGIAILIRDPKKHKVVFSECFNTDKKLTFENRLVLLGTHLEKIIKKYTPNSLAIETLFLSNNKKTVMHVAEVRGVIIYICKKNGIDVFEYNPNSVKVAVTGYGGATKGKCNVDGPETC
jgi:crossover junction endodeoxyribonuclease RuvC